MGFMNVIGAMGKIFFQRSAVILDVRSLMDLRLLCYRVLKILAVGGLMMVGSGGLIAQDLVKLGTIDGHSFQVTLAALDARCLKSAPLVAAKTLCIAVSIKSSDALWLRDLKLTRLNAVMPDHHHGMVTKPKIKAINAGEYLVEGVKLHMSGAWQFNLDFQVAIPAKL